MEQEEKLLTTAEAAKLLGLAPRSVERMANEGRLAVIRTPGGQFRFRKPVVLAEMERRGRRKRSKR